MGNKEKHLSLAYFTNLKYSVKKEWHIFSMGEIIVVSRHH
jgi:hypothetical protein